MNKKSILGKVTNNYLTHTRENKGITLIALVITIVILLILAGISISVLTNTGLFEKAKYAKKKSDDAVLTQNAKLDEYEDEINKYLEGQTKGDNNQGESVTASTIANSSNKDEYYGKIVSGYYPKNDSQINWKILYADSSNIYLIADDYLEKSILPKGTNAKGESVGNKPINQVTGFPKSVALSNVLENYPTGSGRITDSTIKKLNNSYFSQNYSSTNSNMKAVAYMLDKNAWSSFEDRGGVTSYVVGGPTIEILLESYNKKYGTCYQAKAMSESNSVGYKLSYDGGKNWGDALPNLNTKNNPYGSNSTDALGMFLASPIFSGINDDSGIYMFLLNDGVISKGNPPCGFRPMACLKSGVVLKKNGNGFLISRN